jgi:hypothetical protein
MAANKSNEAFKQELAPVRLVDRSWVSDCDLRSRLFVERALPVYFVYDGFRQIPTVAINPSEWDTERHFSHSPTLERSHRSRAIFTIVSLASADNWRHAMTSSRRAKSVQARCRQGGFASTQLSS